MYRIRLLDIKKPVSLRPGPPLVQTGAPLRPSHPAPPRAPQPEPTHNGGPPLDDPPEHVPEWGQDGGACEYFQWKAALKRSRKGTPHDIVMFRLSRAEAAGVDYETYVTELLERGRHLQRGDDAEAIKQRWKARGVAQVKPL